MVSGAFVMWEPSEQLLLVPKDPARSSQGQFKKDTEVRHQLRAAGLAAARLMFSVKTFGRTLPKDFIVPLLDVPTYINPA